MSITPRIMVVGTVITCLAFGLGGCAKALTVAPPSVVSAPERVYVVDYGESARLLLPRRSGRWVEYGYGTWTSHERGDHLASTGIGAGLFPKRAAMSRREHEIDPTPWMRAQAIVPVTVERERAWDLLDQLDFEFLRNASTLEMDTAAEVRWVEDPRRYSAWHHAGHRIGEWLAQMGCGVDGVSLQPRVRLDRPVSPSGRPLPDRDILVAR